MLSDSQIEHYEKKGWLGPFDLLSKTEINELISIYIENSKMFQFEDYAKIEDKHDYLYVKAKWFKSIHIHFPVFFNFINKEFVISILKSLLGMGVSNWGVTITKRDPGQSHRWHIDLEHLNSKGCTLFVGLRNTCVHSSLSIIEGSHKLELIPQLLGDCGDDLLLSFAREHDPDCNIVTVPVADGQFIIMDGRLWHSSKNLSNKQRLAVISQYSNDSGAIKIPLNYNLPICWSKVSPRFISVR